jgi:hypothetical protein
VSSTEDSFRVGDLPPVRPARSANRLFKAAFGGPTAMPIAGNDTASVHSVREQERPLWMRASTDVLALVVNPEIDALLGRPITKDRALLALAARQEMADRMSQHCWLAIERARAAGATWDEVDTALQYRPGQARRLYQTTLTRQKSLGLAARERHDPGTPEGPQL